jgi:ribosomal-protein-alanine N-acetyltransferase
MKKRAYSVRPGTEDDLSQVAAIEEKTIRPPWHRQQFQAELEKKFSHFWVVTDDQTDEKVYAYVVFSFPADQAHVQTIAVDPEQQRQGLASYLMRKLIQYVMGKRGESIILEVRVGNTAAIQFYQKMGFIILRTLKKFYPEGQDGYVMLYKVERTKIAQDGDESLENLPDIEDEAGHGNKNFN